MLQIPQKKKTELIFRRKIGTFIIQLLKLVIAFFFQLANQASPVSFAACSITTWT